MPDLQNAVKARILVHSEYLFSHARSWLAERLINQYMTSYSVPDVADARKAFGPSFGFNGFNDSQRPNLVAAIIPDKSEIAAQLDVSVSTSNRCSRMNSAVCLLRTISYRSPRAGLYRVLSLQNNSVLTTVQPRPFVFPRATSQVKMSAGFSNANTGSKPADPYKATNKDEPGTDEKIQALSNFISASKFGMMTTRIADSGLLVSRCMAVAAKVGGYSDLISARIPPCFSLDMAIVFRSLFRMADNV